MNGQPSSRSLNRQISVAEGDVHPSNEDTEDTSDLVVSDGSASSALTSSHLSSDSSPHHDQSSNEDNSSSAAVPLPTFSVTADCSGEDLDPDDASDNEECKLDDIYNFELSEDQKQAIRELFNLKLDLGFTAEDDNRSNLYDLSERVRQLNEELAKESALPDDETCHSTVKFKDDPVDFISPTPEPELDSDVEPGVSEDRSQMDPAEQSDGSSTADPSPAGLSTSSDESVQQDQSSDYQSAASPTSSAAPPVNDLPRSDPIVLTTNTSSTEFHASDNVEPSQQSKTRSITSANVHGGPKRNDGDDSVKHLHQVSGERGEAKKSTGSREIPSSGEVKPFGRRTGTESTEEMDDMALVECSGKFRMMSVAELTARQRRLAAAASGSPVRHSPGRHHASPGPVRRTPRPPSIARNSRALPLPASGRSQSARGLSAQCLEYQRKTEEDSRRRRDEADAAFLAWLKQKQKQSADIRRRDRVQKTHKTDELLCMELDKPEHLRKKQRVRDARSADDAFRSWLSAKEKQRKNEQRVIKSNSADNFESAEESSAAYENWLRAKAKQHRIERRLRKAELKELNEGVVVHPPDDCQRAYRRWLRRKESEVRQQKETDRQLVSVCQLTSRRSKKSLALAQALNHARELSYTDVYGRRY